MAAEEGVPVGAVSTLAGDGTQAFRDGADQAARFHGPAGVAVDDEGCVYVAEYGGHRIRKRSPQGQWTTLAGSGTGGYADGRGTAAQFNNPFDVALDAERNLYVSEYSNHRIRKVTPDGTVSTLAGSGTGGFADGRGTAAHFLLAHVVLAQVLPRLHQNQPCPILQRC